MQYQIVKAGETVGVIEAESEEAAREELSHERIFGDAELTLTEVVDE